MKHIHHDLIVQWAADTTQVVEFRYRKNKWEKVAGSPGWHTHAEYRLVEPRHKHQDLIDQKAARPELVVQIMCDEKWLSIVGPNWDSMYEYRLVEPAKKKVKMWQWVVEYTGRVTLTSYFYTTEKEAMNFWCGCKVIQRADWTEIEVDEA